MFIVSIILQQSTMKKNFLFIAILLIYFNSFSQKFTIGQLQTLYNSNNSFFDTYAVENGYQFTSANDSVISYNYRDGSLYNRLSIEQMPKMLYKEISERCIVWTFTSANNYLAIKKELADEKYELFQSANSDEAGTSAQYFFYLNKVYLIELTVAKMNFYKYPVYAVVVRKN